MPQPNVSADRTAAAPDSSTSNCTPNTWYEMRLRKISGRAVRQRVIRPSLRVNTTKMIHEMASDHISGAHVLYCAASVGSYT